VRRRASAVMRGEMQPSTMMADAWSFLVFYKVSLRSRRALAMTETELKVIAALAIMGLKSSPNTG
jgi:hypothetical protein